MRIPESLLIANLSAGIIIERVATEAASTGDKKTAFVLIVGGLIEASPAIFATVAPKTTEKILDKLQERERRK